MNHGYEGVTDKDRSISLRRSSLKWESREKTQKRGKTAMRGFRQFDAPVSVVMTCENDGARYDLSL